MKNYDKTAEAYLKQSGLIKVRSKDPATGEYRLVLMTAEQAKKRGILYGK